LFQTAEYLRAFGDAIQGLTDKAAIQHVKSVEFSWIRNSPCKECILVNNQNFPGTDVMITFTKNDPFIKRSDEKLLLTVAMYAWDGNSFPGNFFKPATFFLNISLLTKICENL
jgi:hypothetical protein